MTEERKFAILLAAHRPGPGQVEYGKGVFRGPCHRRCCVHPRTNRCAMAYDCEFIFDKRLL